MRCYQYFFFSLALSITTQTRSVTLSLNDCTFSTSTGKHSHILFCFTVADHWFVSVTTHYLNEQLLSNLTLVKKGALGITTRFVHNHTYQVNNEFTVLCRFSLRGWRVTVRNCRPGLTRSGERHTRPSRNWGTAIKTTVALPHPPSHFPICAMFLKWHFNIHFPSFLWQFFTLYS